MHSVKLHQSRAPAFFPLARTISNQLRLFLSPCPASNFPSSFSSPRLSKLYSPRAAAFSKTFLSSFFSYAARFSLPPFSLYHHPFLLHPCVMDFLGFSWIFFRFFNPFSLVFGALSFSYYGFFLWPVLYSYFTANFFLYLLFYVYNTDFFHPFLRAFRDFSFPYHGFLFIFQSLHLFYHGFLFSSLSIWLLLSTFILLYISS